MDTLRGDGALAEQNAALLDAAMLSAFHRAAAYFPSDSDVASAGAGGGWWSGGRLSSSSGSPGAADAPGWDSASSLAGAGNDSAAGSGDLVAIQPISEHTSRLEASSPSYSSVSRRSTSLDGRHRSSSSMPSCSGSLQQPSEQRSVASCVIPTDQGRTSPSAEVNTSPQDRVVSPGPCPDAALLPSTHTVRWHEPHRRTVCGGDAESEDGGSRRSSRDLQAVNSRADGKVGAARPRAKSEPASSPEEEPFKILIVDDDEAGGRPRCMLAKRRPLLCACSAASPKYRLTLPPRPPIPSYRHPDMPETAGAIPSALDPLRDDHGARRHRGGGARHQAASALQSGVVGPEHAGNERNRWHATRHCTAC